MKDEPICTITTQFATTDVFRRENKDGYKLLGDRAICAHCLRPLTEADAYYIAEHVRFAIPGGTRRLGFYYYHENCYVHLEPATRE